ncbi:envelope stress response membrane protein PspC [Paraglaciecola sp.]|uniref:envelope stress response membrane protein PspC n=1 Tax=Paraglaciecola sp. TaxID=1920173 RepID=UPI00273D81EE|nr:envelope stress response membrane protein PspC [Paraglaciecola sp.]MBU1436380.1 envelope stress response membrane protein PspC [Gammaproteobacteria bacterium]MBU2225246.1 envelope stress response membrane protein PspC [Gammaproteobacteria bacterium]MDP5029538.1 envelope stress response membrane protein PspC [Paraglaciecola sp.]
MTKFKKELLRDDRNGKIAGVCAGIADYFGWELWLVRVVALASLLLGFGGFLPVLYIVGWIVLEKKSVAEAKTGKVVVPPIEKPVEVKTRIWQRGEAPKQALGHIQQQFDSIEFRLRNIETYVTSSKYQLHREFNRL